MLKLRDRGWWGREIVEVCLVVKDRREDAGMNDWCVSEEKEGKGGWRGCGGSLAARRRKKKRRRVRFDRREGRRWGRQDREKGGRSIKERETRKEKEKGKRFEKKKIN
jgi:hypothetical protein